MGLRIIGFYERLAALELAASGAQMPNMQQQMMQQPQGNAQVSDPTLANPNTPVGDLTDALAQMLRLDLSAATSPEQQDRIVLDAVENLVMQLHDLTGEPAPQDNGAQDQYGGGAQDAEDAADGGADDYAEGDAQDQPQQQQPQRRKPQAFAASFDELPLSSAAAQRMLRITKAGRESEIRQLALEGYLTPPGAAKWREAFCCDDALVLSLSDPELFDDEVERLKANGPIVHYGSQTLPQTGFGALGANGQLLSLSGDSGQGAEQNPLIADADSRRNGHKKN